MRADLGPAVFAAQAWRWRRAGLATVCAAAMLLVTHDAAAGEKIQIGGTPEKVDLPKDIGRDLNAPSGDYLGNSIRGGSSSQTPVVPMPNQPSMLRNPKLEEWLDRKKNWMFQSPDSLDREKTYKEIFGVKDYDFTEQKKTKGVVEEYYQSPNEKKTSGRRETGPTSPDRDRSLGRSELDPSRREQGLDRSDKRDKDEPGIIRALDPGILFNLRATPDSLAAEDGLPRSPVMNRGFADPLAGQKPAGQGGTDANPNQPRQGERLWDIGKRPLSRIIDPINDQSDATRLVIDPITARKASVPLPETSQKGPGESPIFGNSLPVPTHSDFFGGSKDRIGSGPSLIPAAAAPASPAPVFTAKPAVLDIPRPRF